MSFIVILFTVAVIFLTRFWYVLPSRINRDLQSHKNNTRTKACKTSIFLGSGGHTAEMLQLVKSLDPTKYNPRSYIVADTDILSKEKATVYEQDLNQGTFDLHKIPRAREVGQSWLTVPFTMILALVKSSRILFNVWPDLIICNGPGSCIPICMLAYIPRILGIKKMEIIYIESFARVESLSLTGKLLYPFVDRFLVQWPELQKKLKKAEYKGILV